MTTAFLRRFVADDTAQDLVEYALLLACLALVAIAGLRSLGSDIDSKYRDIARAISTTGPSGATPGEPAASAPAPSAPAPSAPAPSAPAPSAPAPIGPASGGGSENSGNNGNHGNGNNGQGQGGRKP